MSKIYTKQGDGGYSTLYDGNKYYKNNIIFDVLGDFDELNSHIGLLITNCIKRDYKDEIEILRKIQSKIMILATYIAELKNQKHQVYIYSSDIQFLEKNIDQYSEKNPIIVGFTLIGKNVTESQTHVCRSITRRVERSIYKLNYKIDYNIKMFLNRLSDFFFILAIKFGNDY